jgi:hypothetical protein
MKIESGDHSTRIRIAFDSNLRCLGLIQILSVDPQTPERLAFWRREMIAGAARAAASTAGCGRAGVPNGAPGPSAFTDRTPSRFTGR